MMGFLDVLERIEEDLQTELDIGELARECGMSVYEFRRVFTFVAGISLGEYIRKRRLSMAAAELVSTGVSVTQLAAKYGYDSPSAFSRAFREFHGISPSEAAKTGSFRVMTGIHLQLQATGGTEIPCTLRSLSAFSVQGLQQHSPLTDTECCEAVWSAFYDAGIPVSGDKLYAVYENQADSVLCTIGTALPCPDAPDRITVPESLWAVFTLHTTQDEAVNRFYKDVLQQWLRSMPYARRLGLPNVEVYPVDMETDGFAWELWIPIEKKEGKV